MKNVKRLAGIFTAIALIGSLALTSCSSDSSDSTSSKNDVTPPETPAAYYLDFAESTDNLAVEPGETLLLTVKVFYGTWKLDTDNLPDGITVEELRFDGRLIGIKVTGGEKESEGGIPFTLYPSEAGEDNQYDKTVYVKVQSPYFTVNAVLDESLKAIADKIEVTYSNGTTDAVFTADVEYIAKSDTALVTFRKDNADKWGYINTITFTVYDESGNTYKVSMDKNNWLCYYPTNDECYTEVTLKTSLEESASVIVTFDGFSLSASDSVKVTYGPAGNTETVDAVIASDGQSASFNASNKYVNDSNWLEVKVSITKDGNTFEDFKFNGNGWYEYKSEGFTVELLYDNPNVVLEWKTLKDGVELGASGTPVLGVSSDELQGKNIKALKVATSGASDSSVWWATICSDTDWHNTTDLSWDSDYENGYSALIEDEATIASYVENGIYFAGGCAKIYVYYIEG